jgi:hypothetical protein
MQPQQSVFVAHTCTMLGWLSIELMAVSIMAIFSRFSLPAMAAGNIMVFTATSVPFQ